MVSVTAAHRGIRKLNVTGIEWPGALLADALRPLTQLESLSLGSQDAHDLDLRILRELLTLRRLNVSDAVLGRNDLVRALEA